ncbi:MAG: Cof-type HAD-IIB family hydrolase [Lachnospiraceae bacterium]|nr:Cof-type HAD-IIB family hydrolase [Lachnospiraceae bacterium]
MSYKIIAMDLDGTLTNSEKIITPKTKDALMRIQKQGIKVVLASGRPTRGMLHLEEELELKKYGGYLLSYNGGQIIECTSGNLLHSQTIPTHVCLRIVALARIFYANLVTYRDDELLCFEKYDMYADIEAKINGLRIVQPDNYEYEITTFDIPKFMMLEDEHHLVRIQNALHPVLDQYCEFFTSAPYFLEITPKGIDKGRSLDVLLNHIGMNRSDLVAVGDGMNDMSMIRTAGLGVAMRNGRQEVKNAADYVTLSNDEDGIAHVIEKFF